MHPTGGFVKNITFVKVIAMDFVNIFAIDFVNNYVAGKEETEEKEGAIQMTRVSDLDDLEWRTRTTGHIND